MEAERFLLKWNNHQSNLVTVFDQLYEQEAFTDVTLACDGRSFASHKVILSACSPYFQSLFLSNPCKHPIIFMRDVRAADLDALLAFMYRGEINVHQHDLSSFLKTAESLQIKGLSDNSDKPRDTSKILEAMEKKFNPNTTKSSKQNTVNGSPMKTSNANTSPSSSSGAGNVNSTSGMSSPGGGNVNSTISSLTGNNPTGNGGFFLPGGGGGLLTAGHNLSGFNLSALSTANQVSSSDNASSPPSKKMKTALEELPRILPKMKGLIPPSLVSPVPGLLTPMSLASVMKNASNLTRPTTPESTVNVLNSSNDSPSREMKKEKFDGYSGDIPHPVYLVSNFGLPYGGSGKSTPNFEVKTEDEEDNNSFSDDPNQDIQDDSQFHQSYSDDILGAARDKLTYPCRFCGKRFTQTGTCRRHERLHTSPNSFKCPFCNKGFNRKYRLKEHILASHPQQTDEADISVLVNNSCNSTSALPTSANSLTSSALTASLSSSLTSSLTNSLSSGLSSSLSNSLNSSILSSSLP